MIDIGSRAAVAEWPIGRQLSVPICPKVSMRQAAQKQLKS